MSKAQPMATAPTDGTRILIKSNTWHYHHRKMEYVQTGTQWLEARFKDGKFIEWTGNERISTTGSIDPVAWAPVPEE